MADEAGHVHVLAVGISHGHADALRERDFAVERVESATACLEWIRANEVDAIVSEFTLPSSDGLALLESVRAIGSEVPFAVFTDDGSERIAGRLLAAGASAYVTGSEGPEVLVQRLEDACRADEAADGEVTNRYRHLVETSPVPINLFAADGTVIYGNDAVLDLLGIDDREDLRDRSIFEFVHPDDRDVAERELRAVVEDKRRVGPTRMDLLRPDGNVRHVRVATAPGRYENRDIGQAVVVDVTELQEVQRTLEEERQFIDDALDALPDIFFFVTPDGKLERWNETAEVVTGYDAAELSGLSIGELFVDEDTDTVYEAIERVVHEGQASIEARVLTRDDRLLHYEFRGRRLGSETGWDHGVVGIGRDVSDRRVRDRQLRTIDRVLRHNLRNALTTIVGRAEMLRAGTEDGLAESASTIVRTSESLLETANKERVVVHLLSTRPEPATVDVVDVVETVVDAVEDRYPQATVRTDLPDSATATAVTELSRAVLELVENAIRHDDAPSPSAEVAVEPGHDTTDVRVVDTGPAIPEVELEVLGEGTDTDDQLNHGQGIGLWLVQLVTTLSGGTLTFGRNEPRGNVVTIELRAAERTNPDVDRDDLSG